MFNYQNRGISTLVAIGIIAVLIIVVGGGILGYQYFLPQKNSNQQQTPNNQTNNTQPSITVVSPNGGEAWARGSTHDIAWTSTGVNKITIWAWKEGASDVAEIITGTSQISASLGKYTWTIPTNNNDINLGGNFKVSISAVENQSIKDSSDNYFSIVAPTNQTAGWKTYTNTEYGFEIKYPSDYIVEKNILSNNTANLVFCSDEFSGQQADGRLGCDLKQGGNVSYVDGVIYLFMSPNLNRGNEDNFNGYHYLGSNYIGRYYYLYPFDKLPLQKATIDKMISTFKFTK